MENKVIKCRVNLVRAKGFEDIIPERIDCESREEAGKELNKWFDHEGLLDFSIEDLV